MPRCKCCKDKFEPKYFLQPYCMEKDECIKAFADYCKAVTQKKERKETIKAKKSLLTLSDYEKIAKQVFQKWVRLRDAELPCISCERTSNRYDGGHYFDAGVYSGLIFHEWNCNKQCSFFCNKMGHGNKANYRIGLVKKIGEENVKWLEENKDRLKNYKYTREQLIEITEYYKLKIKQLEK